MHLLADVSGLMSLASACYYGDLLLFTSSKQYPYEKYYPSPTTMTSYIFPPSLVLFGVGGLLLCISCFTLSGDILIKIKTSLTQNTFVNTELNLVAIRHQQNTQLQPYPTVPLTALPVVNNVYGSVPVAQGVSQPPPYTVQSQGVQYDPTYDSSTPAVQTKQQEQQPYLQQHHQQQMYHPQ